MFQLIEAELFTSDKLYNINEQPYTLYITLAMEMFVYVVIKVTYQQKIKLLEKKKKKD